MTPWRAPVSDRALSRTPWSTVPKSRLSLMRTLASLSRDSRCRRAWFSRASSPASLILSASVQVSTDRVLPAHRASEMSVSALRKLHRCKLAGNWSEIGVLSDCISTDFTRHSVSHCLATYPNLRWGRIHLAFRMPILGVDVAVADGRFLCAPGQSRPSDDGLSNAPPWRGQ